MSTIDAATQEGTIDTNSATRVNYSTNGYGAIGISLRGTFTSGTLTLQGTIDGVQWDTLTVYKGTTSYTAISSTGNYRADVVAYTETKLVPSSFVGSLLVFANITTPIFFLGASEMATVTAALPLLSTGGANPEISISGLSTYGTGEQIPGMNAGATALEWKSTIGTGPIALQAVSTATMTLTGVDSVVTATGRFVRTGSVVTADIPTLVGTSNTAACTITGLAVALRPARDQFVSIYSALNADVEYSGRLAIRTTGVMDILWVSVAGGGGISASGTFTASGVKGFGHTTFTYNLS